MGAVLVARGDWTRCTKRLRCPICGSPDWCMVSKNAAICARIESPKRVGIKGAGWLHRTGVVVQPPPRDRREPPPPVRDWRAFADQCCAMCEDLWRLADNLGVSELSLARLCCGFSREHGAYTFPMRDGLGVIIGIRTRYRTGAKLAVIGSHNGIFIPGDLNPADELWICEGPTDCASLLTCGFGAIGRPSNVGGMDHLVPFCGRWRGREVVIVRDRDAPGSAAEHNTELGALTLATALLRIGKRVRLIRLSQAKDVREFCMNRPNAGNVLKSVAKDAEYVRN